MGNIVYIGKVIKKASSNEKRAIEKGMKKLCEKIEQNERQGIRFEKIFNDDTIKYDVLGNSFFTFKSTNQEMPLRILYRFNRTVDGFDLEVHKVYQKKYNDKRYMSEFAEYVKSAL